MASTRLFSRKSIRRVKARMFRNLENPDRTLEDALRAVMAVEAAPFGPLAWLMVRESDERVRRHARLLLFTAMQAPFVPPSVKENAGKAALPVLLDAVKATGLSDDEKLMLRSLLAQCGHEMSDAEFRDDIDDFDAAVERQRDRLSALDLGLPEIDQMLGQIGLGSYDDASITLEPAHLNAALVMAVNMIDKNPLAGSALTCVVAAVACERGMSEFAIRPLDLVRMKGGPHGHWFLSVLSGQPGRGKTGEYAERLAASMREDGVPAEPPRAGAFSHGMLTTVDGAGSRGLMLFFRTDEGDLDGLSILLNDIAGIRDYFHIWGNAADVDDERFKDEGIGRALCDLALAREVFGDALAILKERGVPPPAHSLLTWHLFGQPAPVPKRRKPRLGAYMLETIVRFPGMARESDLLAEDPVWGGLCNPTDEGYALMRSLKNRLKDGIELRKTALKPPFFETFLAIQEKHGKEALLRRMAVNLEVAALAGKAKQAQNSLACRTWLALSEGVVPFASIPYVRALGRKEALMTAENVRHGYLNQRAANDRRLELDDERDRRRWESSW